MANEYTPIEKLEVTIRFEALCDEIWSLVEGWERLGRNTVGEQLVNAADSVGANIIEGGHREGDRDALKFFYYARGSAGETAYFLRRALSRKLIPAIQGNRILKEWSAAMQLLNNLIAYRRGTSWKVREVRKGYSAKSGGNLAEARKSGASPATKRSPKPKLKA